MEEEETSDEFNAWEHLPSSSIPPPPATIPDDPFLSIFPPVNHEGLPVPFPIADFHHHHPAPTSTSTADTNSSPTPLPRSFPANSSAGDPTKHHLYWHSPSPVSPASRWIGFALHLLNSKLVSVFSNIRSKGLRFLFPSESSVSVGGVMTGVSLMLLGVWVWWRRKPRLRSSSSDTIERLNLLIREKDEKIIKLLNQVAELNKLLVARYSVPVMRNAD